MATTQCNDAGGIPKPAKNICDYHKVLSDGLRGAEGQKEAAKIGIESAELARGYALCCLSKTEETFDYYRDLDNYELFDMQKSTESIETGVDDYAKKNGDLGGHLKEASKMLNELKTKLHDANNASCAMRNCLKGVLCYEDGKFPELKKVTDLAQSLSNDGKEAAKAMITISGIHTFSNLDTLKPFAKSLKEKVEILKKLTDEFAKTAGDDAKTEQADLSKVLEELNKAETKCIESTVSVTAHNSTIYFICDGQCKRISVVEEICEEISSEGESEGETKSEAKYSRKETDGD